MKTTIASIVFAMTATVSAVPTTNTYVAVTNDWYNGNWSNVYELAQARFLVNSNDLVAANIMVDYDVLFSDIQTISNSIVRYMRISDAATLPAYTNRYHKMRLGWEIYLSEFLPQQNEESLVERQIKSHIIHKPMYSYPDLKILWDNGIW